MLGWVACEHTSSQIQSRSKTENLDPFYRYVFPPKLSFQLLIFPGRISLYLASCISYRKAFPASLMRCTRDSCSLLLSDEYIEAVCARLNVQGPERCDDSEQGSYTELLLMRDYWWWFYISSYLPQLFYRCLSSPALIFHLNCRSLIPQQKCAAFLRLCSWHWIDLGWQEPKRFECWENHQNT